MKKALGFLFLASNIFAGSAFAIGDYCQARQILEARIALAKDLKVKLDKVAFVKYVPGVWTEAVGNNTGSDTVFVMAGRGDDDAVTESYVVFARQINATADCKITGIED